MRIWNLSPQPMYIGVCHRTVDPCEHFDVTVGQLSDSRELRNLLSSGDQFGYTGEGVDRSSLPKWIIPPISSDCLESRLEALRRLQDEPQPVHAQSSRQCPESSVEALSGLISALPVSIVPPPISRPHRSASTRKVEELSDADIISDGGSPDSLAAIMRHNAASRRKK